MKELKEYFGTVTQKGQVTIPAEVRKLLGVKPRDKVVFRIAEGKVELGAPIMTLEETFGSVTPKQRPEDFKKLRDMAIQEHVQSVMQEMED
jgi:AbrB family looped-hinge helix DNA binding protein